MGCYIWYCEEGTRDWPGPQPAQAPSRCTKCNSPPIRGRGATESRGSIAPPPLFQVRGLHMALYPSLFVVFTCAVAVVIHSIVHSFIHSFIQLFESLLTVSYLHSIVTIAVSLAISEMRRGMTWPWYLVFGCSRELQMAPFDWPYTTFYRPAIVYIALSCTIFEIFDVKWYRDLETWVRGHSR